MPKMGTATTTPVKRPPTVEERLETLEAHMEKVIAILRKQGLWR